MIQISICEDNPVHQEILQTTIKTYLNQPYHIDTFSSSNEFRSFSIPEKCPYDIVFMDIELGKDSGIQLAKEINHLNPDVQIIFITQYMEYVSDVYEADHIYFINKNSIDIYLPKALEKVFKKINYLKNLYFSFSWKREQFDILQKKILYFERSLRRTDIHTLDTVYCTSEKLTELIERLTPAFTICHRSFIINLNAVASIERDHAVLTNNIKIPISRSCYNDVKKNFNTFLAT